MTQTYSKDMQTWAMIASRLEELGATRWIPVIFEFLNRYDGLDKLCLDPETDNIPGQDVLNCLLKMTTPIDDEHIARTLSRLNFACFRVQHPKTLQRWNPLDGPLFRFLGDEDRPACWRWVTPYPDAQEITDWLLARLRQISC